MAVGSKKEKYLKREILFYKNHAENKAGGLVPDLFLLFSKKLYMRS